MIIDDDADHRTTVGILLQGEDLEVLEAGSGEEALERVPKESPDLLLLDFQMGGMNGLQTLIEIRKRWNDQELPILMLSGHQDPDIIAEALDSGANDYIAKSVHPKVLMARVRRHLHGIALRANPQPVLGEFRLQRCLGKGAVSTTFLLQHPKLGKLMAAKMLKPGFSLSPDVTITEVRDTPARVSNLLSFNSSPADYFLTEYLEGTPLTEILSVGALADKEALRVMKVLTETVGRIHKSGRLHGDLRPANILLDEDGSVKLLDLGVTSHIVSDNKVTASDFYLGHPAYQSPEKLRNDETLDFRSDLYSLGAVFFALLTGSAPFTGSIAELLDTILSTEPPLVSEKREDQFALFDVLVGRLLAKDPDSRYESADQVLLNLVELEGVL